MQDNQSKEFIYQVRIKYEDDDIGGFDINSREKKLTKFQLKKEVERVMARDFIFDVQEQKRVITYTEREVFPPKETGLIEETNPELIEEDLGEGQKHIQEEPDYQDGIVNTHF